MAHLKATIDKFPLKGSSALSDSEFNSPEVREKKPSPVNDVVLAAVRVLGTLCVGTAASSNKVAQDHLTSGHDDILDLLVEIVMEDSQQDFMPRNGQNEASGKIEEKSYPDVVRIDAACALGCLCLENRPVSISRFRSISSTGFP